MKGKIILLLAALQLWATLAFENDQQENPRLILLNGRTIDTREAPQFDDNLAASTSTSEQPASNASVTFLLHVSADPEQRETLVGYLAQNYETQLLDYVPHNTFIVEGTPNMMADLKRRDEVVWVGTLEPEDKIGTIDDTDDTLDELVVSLTQILPKRSIATIDAIANSIRDMLLGSGELNSTEELVVTPVHSKTNRIAITFGNTPDRDVAERLISRMTNVAYVEKRPAMHFMNKWGRGIIDSGLHVGPNLGDWRSLLATRQNLRGQGQIIGVADTGLDTRHCAFQHPYGPSPYVKYVSRKPRSSDLNQNALRRARKVVSYVTYAGATDNLSGHGTHVCGSIAGYANSRSRSYHEYDGVAGSARLAFFDIGTGKKDYRGREILKLPNDLGDNLLHWTYVSGGRIHSNSWGSSSAAYTAEALDIDEYMWEHKDFLVLNSAGNGGACAQLRTVGSPSTAKSVISVGASMSNQESYRRVGKPVHSTRDEDDLAYFSSIGPTQDGRIKPDVVVPGDNILSAKSGGGSCIGSTSKLFQLMSGTSMASPLLAGTMSLVRQYFTEGFYPTGRRNRRNRFSPSGSLLKAVAIAGAVPIRGYRRTQSKYCKPRLISFRYARFPNFHHGWGRMQLDRVLEFANDRASTLFHLHIPSYSSYRRSTFGDQVFGRSGQYTWYRYCFDPGEGNSEQKYDPGDGAFIVRVALVWTDAPGSRAARVALVNDLDLLVYHNGRVHRGNNRVDRLNPVEVVELSISMTSTVWIRVRANAINRGPQPFSVVVVGPVRPGACRRSANETTIDDDKPNFDEN